MTPFFRVKVSTNFGEVNFALNDNYMIIGNGNSPFKKDSTNFMVHNRYEKIHPECPCNFYHVCSD